MTYGLDFLWLYDCMMNNISLFLVLFVAMHANLMINLSDKAAIHSKLKSHVYGLPMISPHSSDMVTSSNRNICRFTDPLCGEFTGHRWIPLTKASDAELWCFLWSAPEKKGWGNNHEAGDLKRYRAHYDVTVMINWFNMRIAALCYSGRTPWK